MPACCPSPVCVHHWVSTHPVRRPGLGVPPSGVQSDVQPVRCPVIWLPRPDAAVRPAGVQPVRRPASGVCPSARSQPSRPASAGWWRWGTARYGGQRSRPDRLEFGVVRPRPQRSVDGRPEEAWMPAPLRRSCGDRRGSVGRGLVGWCLGEAAPETDQAGRPPRGRPIAGDCAGAGELAEARGCRTGPCGRPSARSRDYSAWSLRSLTSGWTGPEGPNELGGQDGARPQRGPARK
jgi:hypothetical protein